MKSDCLRKYLITATTLFTLVGALHLTRVLMGWDLTLGEWAIPAWVSGAAVVLVWGLAIGGFKQLKK